MYKNVRWLHFNATSHSFPLSVQTADVAFLLHFVLVFFHTLQFLVHALQVGFHRQTMVVSEAVSVGISVPVNGPALSVSVSLLYQTNRCFPFGISNIGSF